LQQALRGILDAGGNHEQDWQDWPVERIFRVADKATGVTVLSELYEKMRANPIRPISTRCGATLGSPCAWPSDIR